MSGQVRFSRAVSMNDGELLAAALEDLGIACDLQKDANGMLIGGSCKDTGGAIVCTFTTGEKGTHFDGIEDNAGRRRVETSKGFVFNTLYDLADAVTGTYGILDAESRLRREGYSSVSRQVTARGYALTVRGGA